MRRLNGDESGAVMVVVALVILALLLILGLVIDIGGVRVYRTGQQTMSDAAATAGALALAESGNGADACRAARSYVVANASAVGSLPGIDCDAFPATCDEVTGETVATDVAGRFTVSIIYPVPDHSALLDSGVLGAVAQPASPSDGDQCDRVGVIVDSEWKTSFAALAGFESFDADVHSVARGALTTDEVVPLNLLVLDRTGCQSLYASGNGGIYVDAVYDPDEDRDSSNGLQPTLVAGFAAADSDGSDACGGIDGVIDLDGSNSVLRADGPAGCDDQSGTHMVNGLIAGEGCGQIKVFAPGTPGCNFPACTAGGGNLPNPDPTTLRGRITRASVDHRFNCKADYTALDPSIGWASHPLTVSNGQDIPGCPETPNPHLDQLIQAVGATGTPPGFQSWTAAGYPCTVDGSPSLSLVVAPGNWHVDCPIFSVKRTVVFPGGDLVFDGSVEIESSGTLAINANAGSFTAVGPESWVFLRAGHLRKAGDATLIMNNTFLYATKNAHIEMAGGSGHLTWIAPDQGDFDDLALWGDSPVTHLWAGQAELELEGAFFTPFAQAEYSGTSGQNQVSAQFIADRLYARGQGTLVVSPGIGRSIEFKLPQSSLIR